MKVKKWVIASVFGTCLFAGSSVQGEELERRARWHAGFKAANPVGREVTRVDPQSAFNAAGIKTGDVLLTLNGELITNGNQWWDLTYNLRGGKTYQLTLKRNGETLDKEVMFNPAPKESYDNLEVEYKTITSDYGIRQRTITTLPNGRTNKLPAIFVVGGLSCSSIEYLPGRKSNFIRSLRNLITGSDMLVMRVEKPGVGDSEGRCSQTDFKTELNGIEVALKTLLEDPRVDRDKVIIYGSSMGSALAPYLANKYQLNGIISDGTFYRSWFEHMLEIERRIQTMNGHDQTEVNRRINQAYIPLYYGMLIEKKSYQQVVNENPFLREFNYHSPEHMYGRPVSYYHQVQDFDFAGEWAKLDAPARLRWGTHDWIMSEYDIDIIEEVLRAKGHSDFQIYKYPGLDHWDTVHESALNSYQGKPGKWDDRISEQLVAWAQELNGK